MIPIAIAFLLLVVLMVRQYGAPRLAPYLVAMVASWLAAFAFSILIIGNQSAFFLIGPRLLPLDWFMIRGMPALIQRSLALVTALNVSTAVFYYCFLGFALRFSQLPTRRLGMMLRLLTLPPLLVAVVFDPFVIQYLSRVNATRLEHSFVDLGSLFQSFRIAAQAIHAAYLAAGVAILFRYAGSRRRTRRIQRSITYMAFGTVIFALMFAVFYARSPQLLVVPTFRAPYVRMGAYDIPTSRELLRAIPSIQVVVLIIFSAAIARFLRLARDESYDDTRIRHTLRIASLGGRIIGHRVKNQLFAVESEIRALASQPTETGVELRDRLLKLAEMCRQTYQSLGKTIDMLQIPRLHMELSNLVKVASEAAGRWNRTFPDSDVCFMASDEKAMAFVDRTHFDEVMVNLLNNARQASRPGTAPLIFIEIVVDTLWISVRITDRGTGIGSEDMMHLFDPFYSINGGTANWGIGLTYCRSIIDAHDGTIEIGNSEEGGARVELGLPRVQEWQ